MEELHAVSPLDGRYWRQVKCLSAYFSEFALIRYRVLIEIEYFIQLTEVIPALEQLKGKTEIHKKLRLIYDVDQFGDTEATEIKNTEKITNHDVKAVEYFIKDKFDKLGVVEGVNLSEHKEWIHFGLTSQDINNTAIPLMIKDGLEKVLYPTLTKLMDEILQKSNQWMEVPMLARTHGQPATPTRMGKELMVFYYRVKQQMKLLQQVPHSAKFGGATGQFNAHHVAMKSVDWLNFADSFVNRLGLEREQWTTQISNYDNLSALCHALSRINVVLLDLCKDVWEYISLHYFNQKVVSNEVGSSAMPHKGDT
eukprot:TRINITY_DN4890_c0_g1_i1.p1 TRINITY_DN4890_c0_g1~~TRINITY_DN4890_c0_g1_i1.p1  ORF type:complete len:310 (+),score=69.68 TRINITY_DN4890_c0_g1_i1:97-1026(+)